VAAEPHKQVVKNTVIASAKRKYFQQNYKIVLVSNLSSLQWPWSIGETDSFEKTEEPEEDFGEFAAAEPVPSLLEIPSEDGTCRGCSFCFAFSSSCRAIRGTSTVRRSSEDRRRI